MTTPYTISTDILLTVFFIGIIWYCQYHWNRRKLYKCASKMPGPIALPFIGNSLYFAGDPHYILNSIMGLLKQYPPIVRIWHGNRLFFFVSQPKHLEIIFNSPKALQKEELYKFAEPMVGKGLFTAEVPVWKHHRKLILPTFNPRILDEFVEIFAEQSKILVGKINEGIRNSSTLDVLDMITRCNLDTLCETVMGVQVKTQTSETKFGSFMDRAMDIAYLRMFVIWYHFDFIFNRTTLSKDYQYSCDYLRGFTRKVVMEKRKAFNVEIKEKTSKPKNRKAFLDHLLEVTMLEGEQLTDEELGDEVISFLIAGVDTTASSDCFTFIMLGMHPEVQAKAYEEVMEVLGDRPVEPDDLSKLKYLERVIKETLRLFPAGAFVARAITEDLDLRDGYVLPAGTSVVLGILHTHRSEAYWPNPLKFNPDRFLPEEVANRPACCYMPFSYGPRNCIGLRYAMMAMKSLVATVLRSFHISTTYKTVEDIQLKFSLVLRPTDGFQVQFTPRSKK